MRPGGIPDLDNDEPERGHIHMEHRWALIQVLEEHVEKSWLPTDDEIAPVAIVALMPDDAAVLLEFGARGQVDTRKPSGQTFCAAGSISQSSDVERPATWSPNSMPPMPANSPATLRPESWELTGQSYTRVIRRAAWTTWPVVAAGDTLLLAGDEVLDLVTPDSETAVRSAFVGT